MSSDRRLKLVPYAPSDYSLGEVLNQENGYTTEDPTAVGAALSLYFQWEEHRTAVVLGETQGTTQCVMDYDQDERQPSELKIRFDGTFDSTQFAEFKPIKLRFEVFQACYEFSADVMALSQDPESDGWHLIIQVPAKISLYKLRRLPRVSVDDEARKTLGDAFWTPAGGQPVRLSILEIGLRGLYASVEGALPIADEGNLTIRNETFHVRVVRTIGNRIVLATEPKDNQEFGRYFDTYRKVAYPGLIPKRDVSEEEGLQLYNDTNYFGKFVSKDEASRMNEQLAQTWRDVASGQHENTVDYYVTDERNKAVGASSAVRAFSSNGCPVWAFHQFCAITRPDLLERSGYLYTWRAEYLAARSDPAAVIGWYDGKSRWLERIYTKFATQSKSRTLLINIKQRVCSFPLSKSTIESGTLKIGAANRFWVDGGKVIAGSGPKLLNAAQVLESVIVLDESTNSKDVLAAGAALSGYSDTTEDLEVTYPACLGDDFIEGKLVDDVDRLFRIPKDELASFIYSVWHSLAVTKRKVDGG